MAKIAKPQIPLKAYRHFAIITVALTALIAIFASGENREAVADHIEQRERDAHLQRVSAERTGSQRITRRDPSRQERFDGGDTEAFGQPMVALGGASSSSTLGSFAKGSATRRGQSAPIPGYSQAYLNSLTEAEYRRLVANLRAAGMLDPREREQTLANLEQGSRQRSGKASGADELVN